MSAIFRILIFVILIASLTACETLSNDLNRIILSQAGQAQ